ncbi:MAG: trypsin-like peptidase domain-containing protein [Blastocatellia bacterium]
MTEYSAASAISPERRKARQTLVGIIAVVLVALGLVIGAKALNGGAAAAFSLGGDAALPASGAPLAGVTAAGPESLSLAFASVAKTVSPAVVHMNIVKEVRRQGITGFPFGGGEGGTMRQRGSGSGVIVNPNGYILTNNHVVGNTSSIEVKLADGRRLKGTVVGTDPQTDLAVVKIDATSLPYASLGDSDSIQQGEWVVAVGSPFGLEQTITAGIVSATGRQLPAGSPYESYIQTDASINPGNSGGPLVNLRGEVVGINTLIFSESGGSQGIGFAIPSNMAKKIYTALTTGDGKITRGYFGVNVRDLDDALAESLLVPQGTKGAVVADVASDSSPAAKAGIRSGDVITAIDGKPIESARGLTSTVADVTPGSTVTVEFLREGKRQSASVTVAERPRNLGIGMQPDEEPPAEDESASKASRAKLGVNIADVTPEIAAQLKLREPKGAVITRVDPSGVAAQAGLQAGDVIHRFGKSTVANSADLSQAVDSATPGSQIVLQVERRGTLAFVTIELDGL